MADASGSREQVLARIRAAVRKTAAKRPPVSSGPIFPPVEDPLARFQQECKSNYMELVLTPDAASTVAALAEVLASLPAGEIYVQDAPWLRDLIAMTGAAGEDAPATVGEDASAARKIRWSSAGAPAESSQATISLCEALVALTGSVLVSSSGGGRGISVVAPCHIVVARREQLLPDLESALARANAIAWNSSYVGLITGSSRTADIEKLLVIGAHGPRRLVVIMQG